MPPPHPLCDALPAVLITPAPRPPTQQPAGGSASPTAGGSTCSKHGFYPCRQAPPGNSSAHNQRPCLSNPLPPKTPWQHTC